ncbi:radical SAM family heme chaperone HemW [Nonomuraea maheshkhaliensis]|uniref:Heme chaperone HemW n=1 Tax=Nonomuraea maheshkhaliensis TaxID=419590 RepID=A0ABN2FBE0_9ACTN
MTLIERRPAMLPSLPALDQNTSGHRVVAEEFAVDEMGGDFLVYISIPFCRVRCRACPYFVNLLSPRDPRGMESAYVSALVADLERWASYRRWRTGRVRAVYIGGGTGSILGTEHLRTIMSAIETNFSLADDCEITLEGNASDFTPDKSRYVADSGISRVSLGVQSFDPDTLRTIGSPHAANQSISALHELKRHGFDNVQFDMMYNLPGQRREVWQRDLEQLGELDVRHFTIYEYRVHEGTPQQRLIKRGKVPQMLGTSAPAVQRMYEDVVEAAEQAGFEMYMFDYFAKPGYENRYNHWTHRRPDVEVLGIGPGAYGLINHRRFATAKNTDAYIDAVRRGEHLVTFVSPQMTARQRRERYLFNALHYYSVDFRVYEDAFGTVLLDDFRDEMAELAADGLIEVGPDAVHLTGPGRTWHRRLISYARSQTGSPRDQRS